MSRTVIGTGLLMGALVLGSACRQPNPEWLGPAQGSESGGVGSTAGAEETAETGATAETGVTPATGTTTATTQGGDDPAPEVCSELGALGTGACPAECTECIDGVCHVACLDGGCRDELVTCPQGWRCSVACDGRNSCRDGTIVCPGDAACTVACAGRDACRDATVTCEAAACAVTCSADSNTCRSAAVLCGEADAQVSCEAAVLDLRLVPGPGSCACEAQGC